MQIVNFTEKWIDKAVQLALENYFEERNAVGILPETPMVPSLCELAKNGLGVAAVEGEELVGYLGAYGPWNPVFCTPNVCGVFSPLHAHGAMKENRVRIYQRLYQSAAEKWVAAGATSHAITLYAHDLDGHNVFFTYGFGMRCLDLIRSLSVPVDTDATGCSFYELSSDRHIKLRGLRKALSDHLAQSPCFMYESSENQNAWILRKENNPPRVFVAECNGEIAAYMEVIPEGENFAVSVPGTWNICGTYCLPEYRGKHISQALLGYMVSVLEAEGNRNLGVDCESINPTAIHFWSKNFHAYTHSLVRRIDENALIHYRNASV